MAFQYNNQIKIDLKHLLSSLSYSLLMRFSGTFACLLKLDIPHLSTPLFQLKWKLAIKINWLPNSWIPFREIYEINNLLLMLQFRKSNYVFLYSVENYLFLWKLPLAESNNFHISKKIHTPKYCWQFNNISSTTWLSSFESSENMQEIQQLAARSLCWNH